MRVVVGSWLALVALVVGPLLVGRPRTLRRVNPVLDAPCPADPPVRVALIVPARDEQVSLPNLLADLTVGGAAHGGAGAHVDLIVVDDHSTDGTGDLARAAGAHVIVPPPLPDGWRGKTWACHHGAREAARRGAEVLVFVDADVRLGAGAVPAVVAARRAAGGVLSIQPHHEVPTAVEQFSAPFNLVSMMAIGAGTDAPSALTGPLICCTAADYAAVDGHRGVRGSVIEDVALGQRFLAAGIGLRVLRGDELVRFRMYPMGLGALWEGWTKNMAAGATSVAAWRSAAVATWIAGVLSAAWSLRLAVGAEGPTVAALVGLYVVHAVVFGSMIRRWGGFRWWTWALFPLPMAVFCAVFVRSLWATYVRRSVTWKGRSLDLRPADAEAGS